MNENELETMSCVPFRSFVIPHIMALFNSFIYNVIIRGIEITNVSSFVIGIITKILASQSVERVLIHFPFCTQTKLKTN